MQKIRFCLMPRKDKNSDDMSLLYLSLRIDGKRKFLNISQYVPIQNWDNKKKILKPGKGLTKAQAFEKMYELELTMEKCQLIASEARLHGEILSHQSFFNKLMTSGKAFNLISFVEKFIESNPRNWSSDTVHSYEGFLKLLQSAFGKCITQAEIPELRTTLEKTMVKAGNEMNTRKKRHRQAKSFLKWARKEGYVLDDPYTDPIGIIKGHRHFLTVEELTKAIDAYKNHDLPKNLHNTLRRFLFPCFTGCRYSDMVELSHKNVLGNSLQYVAVKTKRWQKVIQAPLEEVSRSLIENQNGRLFNMQTDQTTNRHLKRIFKRIGINKHITYHSSRHTFATLYVYLGGDITNLQEIMGHEDIATTQIYVKMAKKINIMDQKIFDKTFLRQMKVITQGKAFYVEAV